MLCRRPRLGQSLTRQRPESSPSRRMWKGISWSQRSIQSRTDGMLSQMQAVDCDDYYSGCIIIIAETTRTLTCWCPVVPRHDKTGLSVGHHDGLHEIGTAERRVTFRHRPIVSILVLYEYSYLSMRHLLVLEQPPTEHVFPWQCLTHYSMLRSLIRVATPVTLSINSTRTTTTMSSHGNAAKQEDQHVNPSRPQLDLGSEKHLSDKKKLRKQMDRLLSAIPTHEIESQCPSRITYSSILTRAPKLIYHQAANATNMLLSMPEYQAAQTISIFMSMPSREIMTESIVKHALNSGKQVFIPYIYKAKEPRVENTPASIMDMLRLASGEDYASLEPDKWGIPSIDKASVDQRTNCFGAKGLTNGQPPAPSPAVLDLILTPSMAFDQEMNRLGHGKGYYDNFITRYCSAGHEIRNKPFLGMSFGFLMRLSVPFSRLTWTPCSGICSRRAIASAAIPPANRTMGLEG